MSPASWPGPGWAADRGSADAVCRALWRTMVAAPDRYDVPDWRDASAYRFDRLDRPGFAWEWLRRDPAYREAAIAATAAQTGGIGIGTDAAARADPSAERWGLVAFEHPALASPEARPFWRAQCDAAVLVADAAGIAADVDALALEWLARAAALIRANEVEHLLLTDGWRRIRIDIRGGSIRSGPVQLHWHLAGIASTGPKLMTLRRFLSLAASHRFSNRLWPREPRARRWALALRAHDALAAGAGQREIATLFASGEIEDAGWRTRNPSARLQAQRLAVLARTLAGRGFAERFLG